jgi:hypothetical protein
MEVVVLLLLLGVTLALLVGLPNQSHLYHDSLIMPVAM